MMDAKVCGQCNHALSNEPTSFSNSRYSEKNIDVSQEKKTPISKDPLLESVSKALEPDQAAAPERMQQKRREVPDSSQNDTQNKENSPQRTGKKLCGSLLIARLSLCSALFLLLGSSLFLSGCFCSRMPTGSEAIASEEMVFVEEAAFEPLGPEIADLVSPDQFAVLSVDGLPQAFTIYIEPLTGAIIEEWSYYTLGRDIHFMDGSYQGGIEVPPLEIGPDVLIPQPYMHPWEILASFTPESVIETAGGALFRTSALVLPGWNDEYEVARLWQLAAGGNMVTVDGNLALLSVDPAEAIDMDQFSIDGLYIGNLGGVGHGREGAILAPGIRDGTYRLSHSMRGQGTTEQSMEYVIDLEGPRMEGVFEMGKDAWVSRVDIDGLETPIEVTGTVTISGQESGYMVQIKTIVDGRDNIFSGMMGSGFWKSSDTSTKKAITFEHASMESAAEETEEPPEMILVFHDTFDSNKHEWPISYGDESEWAYYQSDIFEGNYLVLAYRKKGSVSFVERMIEKDIGSRFYMKAEVIQEGGPDSGGGLKLSNQERTKELSFIVSATEGRFEVLVKEDSGYSTLLEGTDTSAIHPSGQTNTLSIIKSGTLISFLINYKLMGSVDVYDLEVNRFGMVVSSASEEPIICYYDDLEVYAENRQ